MKMLSILIVVLLLSGLPLTTTLSSEEIKLVKEVANQYDPLLTVSFIHVIIANNIEMIEKIKDPLTELDKSKVHMFDLAIKSHQIFDRYVTDLEKRDYFDFNGTEKVKEIIGQLVTLSETIPVEPESNVDMQLSRSVDDLIALVGIIPNVTAIERTKEIIEKYIIDIETKESNNMTNRLQKLSAGLAKTKLRSLADYAYSQPTTIVRRLYNRYDYETVIINNWGSEVKAVLNKVKQIVGLFYSMFNYLNDVHSDNHDIAKVIHSIPTVKLPMIETPTLRILMPGEGIEDE